MPDSGHPLEFLFHPRSIAVVGASSTWGTSGSFLPAIIEMGFKGDLYPVNPRYDEVFGLKCYKSLRDVPTDVDHVISSVPTPAVPQLVEDAGFKKAKSIHFYTAGMAETDIEERVVLQQATIERTRQLGIRVIGPNCMGFYVPDVGLAFTGGFPKEKGNIAFISQSGSNSIEFINSGGARGLRYSKVISYGNAADLCEADFFDYVADDPETEIVSSYLEGVRDGRRFFKALKKVGARKPVAILKGGRTEAGGRATRSHTASLAGPIAVFDALCRQAGVIRVESLEELTDMMVAFKVVKRLPGPAAAVMVGGGGRSVLSADDVNAEGLEVPHLPEATQTELSEFVQLAGTSIRNPIDAAAGTGGSITMRTLNVVARAPNIDFVLFSSGIGGGGPRPGSTAQTPEEAQNAAAEALENVRRQVDELADVQSQTGKPVVVVAGSPGSAAAFPNYQAMQEAASASGIAIFPNMRRAAIALSRLLRWQRMQEELRA